MIYSFSLSCWLHQKFGRAKFGRAFKHPHSNPEMVSLQGVMKRVGFQPQPLAKAATKGLIARSESLDRFELESQEHHAAASLAT